jgi:hypothetical protein
VETVAADLEAAGKPAAAESVKLRRPR